MTSSGNPLACKRVYSHRLPLDLSNETCPESGVHRDETAVLQKACYRGYVGRVAITIDSDTAYISTFVSTEVRL